MCLNDSVNYGFNVNITYQIYKSNGLGLEEKIPLKIGLNHLSVSKEKVYLTKIYTRWNSLCYKINTTRKNDFRKSEIKLKTSGSKTLEKTEFFFTTEENAYGVTNKKFMDGKVFSTQVDVSLKLIFRKILAYTAFDIHFYMQPLTRVE